MNHHVYVTTAADNNHVGVVDDSADSQPNTSYQSSTYYNTPAPTTYQTVSSMSFPITTAVLPLEEHKDTYLLMNSDGSRLHTMTSSASGMVKEHPAAVQADQMNAFIDSYFVGDQHGASTSSGDHHDQHDGMDHIQMKKGDEDLDQLLKCNDDMDDIQHQISMEQSDIQENYREERSRQRRAAAARSRYQRMTENERRLYNHRRRLRQLGLDPESNKTDMDLVREHVKVANAKKAEAARQRYHRMTPEQKRDYNLRRTEAFRRRRQEEEMLLSTPAGRISAEALAKAQQIMVRNARKAESARLRYQRMSQDERKEYNLKRAAAKKTRKVVGKDGDIEDINPEDQLTNDIHDDLGHIDDMNISSDNGIYEDQHIVVDIATQEQHMLDIINEVAMPSELEIFAQMEKDVVRRTKQAHLVLQRQQGIGMDSMMLGELVGNSVSNSQQSSNPHVGTLQYELDAGLNHDMIVEEPSAGTSVVVAKVRSVRNTGGAPGIHDELMCSPDEMNNIEEDTIIDKAQLIDEKTLHEMMMTGLDASGQQVQITMVDGTPINGSEMHFYDAINRGHPLMITSQTQEVKTTLLPANSSGYNIGASTSMLEESYPADVMRMHGDEEEYVVHEEEGLISTGNEKQAVNRAKRAERARLRYHRMSVEERKEQNARRAEMLRRSRQRDDELCQIADRVPMDQIDEATQKAIEEAQRRRLRRAQQARDKYHRMNSEQRRQYNAMRDAQRRQRKREQENRLRLEQMEIHTGENGSRMSDPGDSGSLDMSVAGDSSEVNSNDNVLYSTYDMFPSDAWDH